MVTDRLVLYYMVYGGQLTYVRHVNKTTCNYSFLAYAKHRLGEIVLLTHLGGSPISQLFSLLLTPFDCHRLISSIKNNATLIKFVGCEFTT